MNYESLFILILVLFVIITFGIHYQRKIQTKKEPIEKFIVSKEKQQLTPLGKGFAEYIPPARKCDPETGCHLGSYADFSTKNL